MNTDIPKGWLESWDNLMSAIDEPAKPPKNNDADACEHGHWIWLGDTKDGMETAWRCACCGLEVLQ